ncbi:MAG: arginine--tRNA ligase [Deltaproteobacteria bacterium]|nr:arginine--tRNA ligase [Deltaproteobacteria bacterium]MBN2672695.1 arginine--tRNA ligase [Deltaproteobacteria bacterium]
MNRYKNAFVEEVANTVGVEASEVAKLVKVPEADRGDFALPCFPFAKQLKQNPAQIALSLAAHFADHPMFEKVEAAGPYVNATIRSAHVIGTLVPQIRNADDHFATSDLGYGQTVVVDFSSPNIAKPLGFHHLRSTMIGNALVNIHKALGYTVKRINFLGDWGKTFGLLAEAFDRVGDEERLKKEGIKYLLELYVEANKLKESDPGFDDAARQMFVKQEQGDDHAMALWELFRSISLKEFKRIYRRLDVDFDFFEGESYYRHGMDEVIADITRTAGTREDQGALVVDMAYADDEPPMMLKKSDGATLYATRDIAAAKDRQERFNFAKSLYVVGTEQKRHFDQLKRALSAMGCDWQEKMVHVNFGRVHGMSTRKGTVVFLEDVLNEARDRAYEKMSSDSADRNIDIKAVAEEVGIGGIVFGDLKNLRASDYTFDWEEILNTKGFTGICVQYAHARCCSILRKAGGAPEVSGADLSLLTAPEEATLVKEIGRIPQAVELAATELEPSRLARALYEAARAWNRYQQAGNAEKSLRILVEDESVKQARLALVDATRIALARGLSLLGVPAPEAM